MNFLNLYYFRVAAEELSFTNAAKRLFISQQSLSNHISRLENEFGVILLTVPNRSHSPKPENPSMQVPRFCFIRKNRLKKACRISGTSEKVN